MDHRHNRLDVLNALPLRWGGEGRGGKGWETEEAERSDIYPLSKLVSFALRTTDKVTFPSCSPQSFTMKGGPDGWVMEGVEVGAWEG